MKILLKLYVLLSIWSCSQPCKDWQVVEKYPSGRTKTQEYKCGDPIKTYVRVFYESGKLRAEESYLDTLEDGLFTFWYENGNKMKEIYFEKGGVENLFTEYYPNGALKSKSTMKDNAFHGRSDYYSEDGHLNSWAFSVDDELYYKKNYTYDKAGNLLDSTEIFRPKVEFDSITDPLKIVITARLPLDENIFPIDSVYAEYSLGKAEIKPNINTLIASSSKFYPVGKGFELTYKREEGAIEDHFAIRFYYINGEKIIKLEGCIYPINLKPPKK